MKDILDKAATATLLTFFPYLHRSFRTVHHSVGPLFLPFYIFWTITMLAFVGTLFMTTNAPVPLGLRLAPPTIFSGIFLMLLISDSDDSKTAKEEVSIDKASQEKVMAEKIPKKSEKNQFKQHFGIRAVAISSKALTLKASLDAQPGISSAGEEHKYFLGQGITNRLESLEHSYNDSMNTKLIDEEGKLVIQATVTQQLQMMEDKIAEIEAFSKEDSLQVALGKLEANKKVLEHS